jgi:hypothetical protein
MRTILAVGLMLGVAPVSYAQGALSPGSPMQMPGSSPALAGAGNAGNPVNHFLADNSPPDSAQPIDLTPVPLPKGQPASESMRLFQTTALYYLPPKMFFSLYTENSLRYENNVFQTRKGPLSDMIYRVYPDVTLGYALNRKTRISADYFMYRDNYGWHAHSLDRTVHSLSLRADRDFYLNPTTVLTTSVAGRQLFITRSRDLSDIMPQATVVHRVGAYGAVYGSVIGQLRFQHTLGRWQEGDQFYSIGAIYKKPMWRALADFTWIDNFGDARQRGGVESNHQAVITLEAGRRVSPMIPLVAFLRVQPIFNVGDERKAGYAPFDLRLFSGIRLELAKPAIFPVKLRSG